MLLLAMGIVLTATAVALVARGAALPRLRAAERVAAVGSYGFGSQEKAPGAGPLTAALDRAAVRLGDAIMPKLRGGGEDELRNLLMSAGVHGTAPGTFLGYRALGAIALPVALLWLGSSGGAPAGLLLVGAPIAAAAGWMLPIAVVRDRAQRRLATIDYELPELIDSLMVTVEAGMGFGGAMQLAAQEMSGPLATEVNLMLHEQTMGMSTEAALEGMVKRSDTPAMRSFVRSYMQGESLGVSIGEIMRSLAVEMRARRRAAAEERAHKAPVKMLFPLVLLIFPATLIVLLYPGLRDIMQALGS